MDRTLNMTAVIAIAVVGLLLGFGLGFWVKPGGVPTDTHEQTLADLAQARGEADGLRAELNNLQAEHQALTQARDDLAEQAASQQAELARLGAEAERLRGTAADLQTQLQVHALDAQMMNQLKSFFSNNSPFQPGPPATLFHALGDGSLLFLQFDAPVTQATQLRYWGTAVPGRFCRDAAYETLAADGFVHFRAQAAPNESSASGGRPGEQGYWMKFVALDTFDMPWGEVVPGVDLNYRPTEPPACAEE